MKRTRKEVRNAILKALKDGKPHSYAYLERKVDTNWKTIRDHVDDLIFFKMAEMVDGKVKKK